MRSSTSCPESFRAGLGENMSEPHDVSGLLEVIVDLGRVPEARFVDGSVVLSEDEVTREEHRIRYLWVSDVSATTTAPESKRTLHRFSVIRDRESNPVGLTCRVGRAVFGSVKLIQDLIESGT